MQKPTRKNSHKERIFSLAQNKVDFEYQKERQNRIPQEQKTSLKRVESPFLLNSNKARESLKNIDGWQLTDDHKMIYREFILHDFMTAIDLIDGIALIAENEKHHPDIHLTKYRNLRVCLTTHDVGGLSDKDFLVALKINSLPIPNNKAVGLNQQLKNKTNGMDHQDKSIQKSRDGKKTVGSKQRPGISKTPKKNDGKMAKSQTKRSFKA